MVVITNDLWVYHRIEAQQSRMPSHFSSLPTRWGQQFQSNEAFPRPDAWYTCSRNLSPTFFDLCAAVAAIFSRVRHRSAYRNQELRALQEVLTPVHHDTFPPSAAHPELANDPGRRFLQTRPGCSSAAGTAPPRRSVRRQQQC